MDLSDSVVKICLLLMSVGKIYKLYSSSPCQYVKRKRPWSNRGEAAKSRLTVRFCYMFDEFDRESSSNIWATPLRPGLLIRTDTTTIGTSEAIANRRSALRN